jgi:type IV pilus assembly protein PilV
MRRERAESSPTPSASAPSTPSASSLEQRLGRKRGFTLIEAMVALVVLSVGMMGIAAMYSQGLGAGRTAQLRTQAVNLVSDMADRIRVNRLGGAAYAGAAANNQCDPQTGGGVDCAPDEMAAHDLYTWSGEIAERLPNGRGTVAYDAATAPPTYTITVCWHEASLGTVAYNGTAPPASCGDEDGQSTLYYQMAVQVPAF